MGWVYAAETPAAIDVPNARRGIATHDPGGRGEHFLSTHGNGAHTLSLESRGGDGRER